MLLPLLFEAALAIRWRELKRDALPILILSVFGVVISCIVVTAGMTMLLKWPLAPALLFGVLISATDPVAVIAMFKDTGVGGRLRLLVESESLFNDGVAAVFFVLALGFAQAAGSDNVAGGFMSMSIVIALVHTALGGVAVGLVCGGVAIFVIGRADDYLIETAVTTVTAYGAFLMPNILAVRGVLATVAAGLLIGNLGILAEQGLADSQAVVEISSLLSGNTLPFWLILWISF
jgi:CPA1 family monovalent cation:H+ antiporter